MAYPLLPSLKDENKIAITKRGQWTSDTQTSLKNLVTDLKVISDDYSNISSIPDIWARPLLCEMILLDEYHSLHKKYVKEWRGLMAMLAFRQLRNFTEIGLETVVLPAKNSQTENCPDFLKVLVRMLPKSLKDTEDKTLEDGQVAKLQILTYAGKPLAIVWPNVLVCSAAGLEDYPTKNVSWWNTDGISDPISTLNGEEKQLLKSWLQNISDALPVNVNNDVKLNQLSALFNDFIKDLGDSSILNISQGKPLGITGFARVIDSPILVKTNGDFLENTSVRLIDQKTNNPKNTLLVVTDDLPKQWNVAASEINIGGYVTFDAVKNILAGIYINHNKLNDTDLSEYGAELRRADEFFTDRIGIINMGIEAFPGAISNSIVSFEGSKVNVILPIKEELLEYLTAEYIAKHVNISASGSSFHVELELPLSGINGKEASIIVTKDYDFADNVIFEYEAMPVVSIWPNFKLNGKNWKAYYSYFDTREQDTFYVKPFWHDDECLNRPIKRQGIYDRVEIVRGTSFPEAYICYGEDEKASGKEAIAIGLILLKPAELVNISQSNKVCRIGVDFGTTNTIAYMAIEDGVPDLIRFENRMRYVTQDNNNGFNEVGIDELRRNFMTVTEQPNDKTTSIMTMFHTHDDSFDGDINKTLFRGNIYCLEDSLNFAHDKNQNSFVENIHTNMKWESQNGTYNSEGFIKQLCQQCLAEAAVKGASAIEWRYSYPKAFSVQDIESYKQIWNTVYQEIKEISDITCVNKPKEFSESVTMAEYFVDSMKATVGRGIVCLDIGGGSTDIAIWEGANAKTRAHASIRFAGRDILSNYLYSKRELLNNFKTNDLKFNKQIEMLKSITNKNEFVLQLDALLKYNEDTIFANLNALSKVPAVNHMIRNMAFSIAGIFYYVGMMVGYLRKNNEYDEKEELPSCYIGGNGSKLLNWVHKGSFDKDARINNVFACALMDGIDVVESNADFEENFDIIKTELPKQEVAYGLVCDKLNQLGNSDSDTKLRRRHNGGSVSEDKIIAGEKYVVKNGELDDPERISCEDFAKLVQVDRKCPLFRNFVEKFNDEINSLGYEKIDLKEKDYANITAQVDQELIHKSKMEKNNMDLEPIFILLLKHTLKIL